MYGVVGRDAEGGGASELHPFHPQFKFNLKQNNIISKNTIKNYLDGR